MARTARWSGGADVALVAAYLSAIVAANLLVAALGPRWLVLTALLLIPLDLVVRDALHERWEGPGLWARMVALVASGGLVTWAVTDGGGTVPLASSCAFAVGGMADAAVFGALHGHPRSRRMVWSNAAGAVIDTLVFVAIAFPGKLSVELVASQAVLKWAASGVWTAVLLRWWFTAPPPHDGDGERTPGPGRIEQRGDRVVYRTAAGVEYPCDVAAHLAAPQRLTVGLPPGYRLVERGVRFVDETRVLQAVERRR